MTGKEEVGIQNIKELSDLVLSIGNGASLSLADGKLGWTDLVNFSSVPMKLIPAMQGIGEVDDEFFAMTPEQKTELKVFIAGKLELDPSHEKIEQITEAVLKTIIDLKQVIALLAGVK